MTADPLTFALRLDPAAGWASDEWDENCLFVGRDHARRVVDAFPAFAAYEDPNPPEVPHTRVVFPLYRVAA